MRRFGTAPHLATGGSGGDARRGAAGSVPAMLSWGMPGIPAFPSLPARVIARGRGRLYRVAHDLRLICWRVEDPGPLPLPPGTRGILVYAFVEGRRLGGLHWTWDPADIESALARMRAVLEPDSGIPAADPTMIRRLRLRELVFTRGGEPEQPADPGPPPVRLPVIPWD